MTKASNKMYLALLAAALVIAAGVGIAFLADGGESAGREHGIRLSDVVDHPARYDGKTVTVSGEWAENDYFSPSDASLGLVIGDDAGKQLLVIPALATDVPRVGESTVVQVRGTVHALADDDAGRRYVQPGGILASEGMDVLMTAERVSISPSQPKTARPDARGAVLAAVAGDPRAFDGQVVTVTGTAHPSARGFVLSDNGTDLFVSAPSSSLKDISDGQRVRVEAKVQRLSGLSSRELEHAVQTDPPGDQPGEPPVLDRLPTDPGEPYLLFRSLA